MADYIYLLESRLSKSQQNALLAMRGIAREKGLTIFLVGGAVRDLTSGSPVRDLDVVVQGNALKLKREIEKAGGRITGEHEPGQALFVQFPRGVKLEIASTLTVTYPKPGKPVVKSATILDDLRRRDFTANAMALSLNDGSYGLLMDPLNGVADIENRELRLVSNYGFIEDPIRMVRAARLMARLGWQMDEKTAARYETGKQEGYIAAASKFQFGYEAEEIVHEEDPLRVLNRLEAEGWMKVLAPFWTAAKVNVAELEKLRETQSQLQIQGIHPNTAAANFPLLTAKLSAKEVAELKASFPRQGFVKEIEALEGETKELAAQLTAKSAALPSQAWKLLHAAKPEAVLMVAHGSAPGLRSAAIQAKFKSFYTEWPLARQKVPYTLMQEMRIQPDLAGYTEFVDGLIFELMDGKLGTVEEMKAFLEPFSPPAPPPPVHLRRPRAAKKESKAKARSKKAAIEPTGDMVDLAAPPQTAPAEEMPVESAPKPVKVMGGKTVPAAKAVPVAKPVAPPVAKVDPAKAAAPAAKKAVVPMAKSVAPTAKKVAVPTAKIPTPIKAAAKSVPVAKKVAPARKAAPIKTAATTKKTLSAGRTTAVKTPIAKAVAKKASKTTAAKATAKKPATKAAVATAPPKAAKKKLPTKPAAKKAPVKKSPKAKPAAKVAGKKRR